MHEFALEIPKYLEIREYFEGGNNLKILAEVIEKFFM